MKAQDTFNIAVEGARHFRSRAQGKSLTITVGGHEPITLTRKEAEHLINAMVDVLVENQQIRFPHD